MRLLHTAEVRVPVVAPRWLGVERLLQFVAEVVVSGRCSFAQTVRAVEQTAVVPVDYHEVAVDLPGRLKPFRVGVVGMVAYTPPCRLVIERVEVDDILDDEVAYRVPVQTVGITRTQSGVEDDGVPLAETAQTFDIRRTTLAVGQRVEVGVVVERE